MKKSRSIQNALGKARGKRVAGMLTELTDLDTRLTLASKNQGRGIMRRMEALEESILALDPDAPLDTPCRDRVLERGARVRKQRQGTQEELDVAASMGADVHSNSGAGDRKSDSSVHGAVRIENKETSARSFQITLAELMKIEAECEGDQIPVFTILFKKAPDGMARRFAIVPYRELLDD